MSFPLITVVTVVLNDSANIKGTLESVLSQTYPEIEYIVIDGGSTDGTQEIIKEYNKQISIFISEKDNGIYDAMNKGTSLASGQWLIYMNSGDRFYGNDVLYKIFIKKNLNIACSDVIFSDVIADYKTRRKLKKAKRIELFWQGMPFSHQAHLVKASIAKTQPFNLKYIICADYDFLYSIYRKNATFYYCDYPIAIVDVTKGISKNISLKFLRNEFFDVTRKYSSNSQIIMNYLLTFMRDLYAIFRRLLQR